MNLSQDDAAHEISPYSDAEFRAAMKRALKTPLLPRIVQAYFPQYTLSEFVRVAEGLETVSAFQAEFIGPSLRVMLDKTSRGQTIGGMEKLSREKKYVFLSNHRDILLDSALFTRSIFLLGFGTPKICLGDNLLANPWIIDLVKMNKGVTVKRQLSQRELFKWSQVLARVIRSEVESGRDSVWLAQRDGRAKDGIDQTHPGVLKMLSLSGEGSFVERLASLHCVPMAISYELDPNDAIKARELYLLEAQGHYEKAPGEDIQSILQGIQGAKGRIHIEVGSELSECLEHAARLPSKADQVRELVEAIDRQIQQLYRNWPTHYVAYDLLFGEAAMAGHYTPEEKTAFEERMEQRLAALGLPPTAVSSVRRKFLEMYANPVVNALKYKGSLAAQNPR